MTLRYLETRKEKLYFTISYLVSCFCMVMLSYPLLNFFIDLGLSFKWYTLGNTGFMCLGGVLYRRMYIKYYVKTFKVSIKKYELIIMFCKVMVIAMLIGLGIYILNGNYYLFILTATFISFGAITWDSTLENTVQASLEAYRNQIQ